MSDAQAKWNLHIFPKKWWVVWWAFWSQCALLLAGLISFLEKKQAIHFIPRDQRKEFYGGIPGVNLVGAIHAECGFGESARFSVEALSTTDVPLGVIDCGRKVLQRSEAPFGKEVLLSSPKHKINLFQVNNAVGLVDIFFTYGKNFFLKRYNIECPFWELEQFPAPWVAALALTDEVWASSRFLEESLLRVFKKPVIYMPAPVSLPAFPDLGRAYFNIPEDRYVFFFVFDFFSYMDRKNPMAVVRAFKQAFLSVDEKVSLVIKAMNADGKDEKWKRLRDLIGEDPRIRVINETMGKDELLALEAACDCFVSLHRSEGLGLGMLEAMLLEKPVICTKYSGNLDYATDDHACLVSFNLIPVEKGQYPFYKGQVWADPDIEHAAWYMRKLYNNRELGKALGRKAAQFIRERYDPVICGERYKKRFLELGLI